MKNIKKLLALVLALAICAAFAVPALAGEEPTKPTAVTNKLTFSNANAKHTYEVYQILAGDVASGTNGELTLSNIKWGTGVDKDSVVGVYEDVDALLEDLPANATEDAVNEVAKKLIDVLAAKPNVTLSGSENYEVPVDGGYYLIVDRGLTEGETAPKPDYVSAYMMRIVGNISFVPKVTKTTSDKDIIVDPNAEILQYVNANGYNIGDTVTFSLKATVPVEQLSKYDNYMLRFNDTMSSGLTFTAKQEMKLNVFHVDGETSTKMTTSVSAISEATDELSTEIAYKTGANNTVNVLIPDLFTLLGIDDEKNIPEKGNILVEVIYTAVLNKDALVYPAVVEGKPNFNAATLDFSNDPNDDGSWSTTPPSEVYPYTFAIDGTKVDGKNTSMKLEGAIFQLKDKNGSALQFVKVTGENNTIRYIHYGEDAFEPAPEEENIVDTITSDINGKFVFEGLKEGTYTLVETQAPAGYNKLDYELQIDISATYAADGSVTVKHTETKIKDGKPIGEGTTSDNIGVQIENNEGSLLPSTGGIGTTIFYIVGAVLVVGAGVLLFTKRRTSN